MDVREETPEKFPADCLITESARPRYEARYEYGIRPGWDDDRRSGIDLTLTRRGIEVGGFYDSMVGLQGGFISWEDVDKHRARLNERIPRLSQTDIEAALKKARGA